MTLDWSFENYSLIFVPADAALTASVINIKTVSLWHRSWCFSFVFLRIYASLGNLHCTTCDVTWRALSEKCNYVMNVDISPMQAAAIVIGLIGAGYSSCEFLATLLLQFLNLSIQGFMKVCKFPVRGWWNYWNGCEGYIYIYIYNIQRSGKTWETDMLAPKE